jgi:hypothetical protein
MLLDAIYDPVEAYIDGLATMLLKGFIGNSSCSGVVCDDSSSR